MLPVVPLEVPQASDLRGVVIIHAGNPDEGCCGIWVGAPLTSDEVSGSPWAWIEPMWMPDGLAITQPDTAPRLDPTPRHDEMPEPADYPQACGRGRCGEDGGSVSERDLRTASALFDPTRLRIARQAAMLRKKDLAERVGVSAAAVLAVRERFICTGHEGCRRACAGTGHADGPSSRRPLAR